MFLVGFPLLVIPFALYNMLAFLLGIAWSQELARFSMVSGEAWTLTPGEILIAGSILLLFVEMLKSTRMSTRTIVDHILSTVLFMAMLIEFLLVKQAASGTFFLLLVISFVDVVGGFTITIRTAQRDISVDRVDNIATGA
ncbi:unnamed protein product [Phaeothamnion confervicola]